MEFDLATVALLVYTIGVAVGLAVMYEPFPARALVALCWPIGPAAFVVTVSILLATAAFVLRPLVGASLLALLVLLLVLL